jgi:hypothetical protein
MHFHKQQRLYIFAVKHEVMVYICISVLDCICSYKISTFKDYLFVEMHDGRARVEREE